MRWSCARWPARRPPSSDCSARAGHRELVLTRRGLRPARFTLAHNLVTGVVASTAGAPAGLVFQLTGAADGRP